MTTFDVVEILQGADYQYFNLFFSIIVIFGFIAFGIGLLVRVLTRS